MDQDSMHGEIAVYLTDPIAQQHIVIEQSTTLYFDAHAEGKLIENHGSRPGSRQNTYDSKMQQFFVDMNTESSNVIYKGHTELAQDGADESDNSMISTSILDLKPNDSDIGDKLDDTPGLCRSPGNATRHDSVLIEKVTTSITIDILTTEGIADDAEFQQNVDELDRESPHTICKQCTEPVQGLCEECTKLGQCEGKFENLMAQSPIDNSKCPQFVQDLKNCNSPRTICKECIELEEGTDEIEDPMAECRTDNLECPQCFEEMNNKGPKRLCKECIELAQGANVNENQTDSLASDTQERSESPEPACIPPDTGHVDISDNEQFAEKMNIDSPQYVKEIRIEIPTKTCEECIELAQGANVIENVTEAFASDTRAESDEVREKRFETPDSPGYTPPDSGRVDNSDNEQFAENRSIDSPHENVEETRIEIPKKTCEECIDLAQGANYATENPTELAFASDYTQAEEKRSDTTHDSPGYTPPDSGRGDIISENEQNPEEMTTMDIPKFPISDVAKLAAEGGHVNESLINMCIILNPNPDDQPDKNNELTDATDLRGGSGGGSDDMSSGALEILEKIEDLNSKYTEATQKTENLELNLWDLTEKIRLLQCKIEKQEQQINDAQSKQVEQERILLSPMRNIFLRQFHDQIREGIAKKLSKTALYADHHKGLCLRVQTNKEVSRRFGIEHFFNTDLWSLMHEAHTRAPKAFSKAALWNHFVSDVLQDSALLERELGLSAAAVGITKFGRSPDAEDHTFKAQMRNKVVYAELVTRQDEERRPAYSECYEFLFNVPPESMNNKPSFLQDGSQPSEESDAPSMQTMANVVEKSKQPVSIVDSGASGEASASFSSTASMASEDSE